MNTANEMEAFQIMPGRASCIVGEGDAGEVWFARCIAALTAERGRKVTYVVVGSSDATEELEGVANLSLEKVAAGDLARFDEKALTKLVDGAELVVFESLRGAVGTSEAGACYRALGLLEKVSNAKGVAIAVLTSSPAPELHDALGSVIVAKRGERKGEARVHRIEQIQQPRSAFEAAPSTCMVIEPFGDRFLCRLDVDGLTHAEREQRASDAEIIVQAVLDRPGTHLPAGETIDITRAQIIIADLVKSGRLIAKGDRLVPELYPSAQEVQKRADIDARVLKCVETYPYVLERAVHERLNLDAEVVAGAIARLRASNRIRRLTNEAGVACLLVEALARREDAFARALAQVGQCLFTARDLYQWADLDSVEQAQEFIDELLERGEIQRDDTALDVVYMRVQRPQPPAAA